VNVPHGLRDATGEYVSGEADYLLGPDERVRQVIRHGTETFVSEHGEFVQPWVIDEARVAQPVDRELWVVGIWDDRRNDANLRRREFVISYTTKYEEKNENKKGGGSKTHMGTGFWAGGIMKKG